MALNDINEQLAEIISNSQTTFINGQMADAFNLNDPPKMVHRSTEKEIKDYGNGYLCRNICKILCKKLED